MSGSLHVTTGLKAQYAAQVAADLDRSSREQERVVAELARLQEELVVLQHDHALLMSMHQTLADGVPTAAGTGRKPDATAVGRVPHQPQAEPKPTGRKPAPAQAAAQPTASAAVVSEEAKAHRTTLVGLVHDHLRAQSAPSSAAEVTAALVEAHPDRRIKATVVRTTVEGLVAKGLIDRIKQGKSVFYTAVGSHDTVDQSHSEPAPN